MIEPLESRVAPATLLNPTTVTYQDTDGDIITVRITKPLFTPATVDTLLLFDTPFATLGPQKLITIAFAQLPDTANGLGLSVTVKRNLAAGGNGSVQIFEINASDISPFGGGMGAGIDLGKVSIQGEISRIDVGDPDATTVSLQSLRVQAFCASGPTETSNCYGIIGTVNVRGNFGATWLIDGGDFDRPGLAKLTVGGSFGPPDGNAGGRIQSGPGFGTILIKGNLIGGADSGSGSISTNLAPIQSLTVGGSIFGGRGDFSGRVDAGFIANVKIGGSIIGNDGPVSGALAGITGGFGKIVIGGSLIDGRGGDSGQIRAGGFSGSAGNIASLLIKGSVIGVTDQSAHSGPRIEALGSMGKVTILGDFVHGNIIAGVDAGPNGKYGDGDDIDDPSTSGPVISTITRLIIKGAVYGTGAVGDSYGIEANRIDFVQIGTALYKRSDPALNFPAGIQLASTGDVLLREVN